MCSSQINFLFPTAFYGRVLISIVFLFSSSLSLTFSLLFLFFSFFLFFLFHPRDNKSNVNAVTPAGARLDLSHLAECTISG